MSFRVGDGAKVALVGANGAGKTTLLRTISGVQPASGGTISLFGQDVSHATPQLPPTAVRIQVAVASP